MKMESPYAKIYIKNIVILAVQWKQLKVGLCVSCFTGTDSLIMS